MGCCKLTYHEDLPGMFPFHRKNASSETLALQNSRVKRNNLGNVLSIISDKVLPHANGTTLDYYLADNLTRKERFGIRQSSDYSPFGVQLSGRNFVKSGAKEGRFGFQGQEEDDEIKGDGNSVNYSFRMHDPRLGRFFEIDLLTQKFPSLTPYQFCSNSPIYLVEIDGKEGAVYVYKTWYDESVYNAKKVDSYVVEGLKSNVNKLCLKPYGEPNGETIEIRYDAVMPNGRSASTGSLDPKAPISVKKLNYMLGGNNLPQKVEPKAKPIKIWGDDWDGNHDGAGHSVSGGNIKSEVENGVQIITTIGGFVFGGGPSVTNFAVTSTRVKVAGAISNAGGNAIGQYASTGNFKDIDILSVAGAGASSFLPGGVSKKFAYSMGIVTTEALLDVKYSNVYAVGVNKSNSTVASDFMFGAMGKSSGTAFEVGMPSTIGSIRIQNTRNFIVGGMMQFANGKVNEHLENGDKK